ncbi:MAG: hypothetical protein IPP71_09425 [Bacteroidetes bacterium]|nr:hypothetical protein [Bacteroidota bacterium]
MNSLNKLFFIVVLVFITQPAPSQQSDVIKQSMNFIVDENGNGLIEISMKLNASTWDNFKRTMGTNVSILKREMERALPGYFLQDFDYKEEEMERTYTLSMKALGVCEVDKKGKWVLAMEEKNPDVTKVSDNIYLLTNTINENGMVLQQNIKVTFPESASNVEINKDSFGKAKFTFEMPSGRVGGIPVYLISGIGLLAGGLFSLFRKKKTEV